MSLMLFYDYNRTLITSYLNPNTFSISTDSESCYKKILDDAPWHFMGRMLVVKEWDPTLGMEEVDLSSINFWV